jgi:hypothetical protein
MAQSDDSSSTSTSSINGNTEAVVIGAGISSTQIDATHTSGNAIAAAIATPIFTASGGGSFGQGGSIGGTGPQTQGPNLPGSNGSGGTLGHVLNGGSFHASLDPSDSDTFALNHVALWIVAAASETQGSATTSSTTSAGVSVAGLFVFGQTTAVSSGGKLTDQVQFAPEVTVGDSDLNNNNGYVALNLVAGVGNLQGNNLTTLTEVTGGANSVNVEGNQTLADAGTITDQTSFGGESATLGSSVLTGNAGAAAANVAAGVGNQQANNITLSFK